MTWDYKVQYKSGEFDVVFASPPCDQFSRARTTAPRNLDRGDKIVKKTLEIINYFKPRQWCLENPRTGLLSQRPYMVGFPTWMLTIANFPRGGIKNRLEFGGTHLFLG